MVDIPGDRLARSKRRKSDANLIGAPGKSDAGL